MKVFLLTLFPRALESYFETSMMRRAQEMNLLELKVVNLADYSVRNTRRVDDRPYGWWSGTVLAAEPCAQAIEYIQSICSSRVSWYAPDPRWTPLTQWYLSSISEKENSIGIICGHYEGIDERIFEYFNIQKVSLGPYIITGGELAAWVLIDGIIRLIPGLLDPASLHEESYSPGLDKKLEYPHFTRPEVWRGNKVPPALLSWNHATIVAWRKSNITSL